MNIEALKAALQPLTQWGQDEHTFDVEGVEVTLRPLLPKEEIACQSYAAAVLAEAQEEEGLEDDDPLSRVAALRYFDKFRTEVISYALVAVGAVDFRGIKYLETGEVQGGMAVKITKHVAVRSIVEESWSRGMITITFSKYGDLITKIAEKADKIAKESVGDLEAEIDRVEIRLQALKRDLDSRAKGDSSVTSQQIRSLVQAGEQIEQEINETIDTARADREAAEAIRRAAEVVEEPPAPAPREPVTPKTAPPPTSRPRPPAPKAAAPAPEPEPAPAPAPPAPEPEPAPKLTPEARIRAAQEQSETAAKTGLGASDMSQAQPAGTIETADGPVEVFRLPSETLSERGMDQPANVNQRRTARVEVDPDPAKSSLNPNFKPPGGR
jgi:outer membrane biosynthesis protein TonB